MFSSHRFSYIGTLTDPGVDDPQATNPAGWFARTYQYSATIPHAVTSVNPETGSADTYEYDANGNMTCRNEGGVTYKQTYNAENRISTIQKLASGTCASPGNLSAHWAFAYDGDGTRVSTLYTPYISGQPQTSVLTVYYMGGSYEITGAAVKKYYSIAGMMVAVKEGSEVQYLLTDHLGSTVAVTNSSGTLTSQQRYLPFGEPRTIPNSPITQTDFTYTGQRKLDEGMGGIMDYKARFYSPALGRFLQPDNIVPHPINPQSWNRFSYVLNNPIRYNDPSGHTSVCAGSNADPECNGGRDNWTMPFLSAQYNILFTGGWSVRNRGIAGTAVQDVANALLQDYNQSCGWSEDCPATSATELFIAVYDTSESNPLIFQWGCSECNGAGGYTYSSHKIGFASLSESTIADGGYRTDAMAFREAVNNVVHELGHAFAKRWYYPNGTYDPSGPLASLPSALVNNNEGFYPSPGAAALTWRQHPYPCDTSPSPYCGSEEFADMFLGWTYGMWADNRAGEKRADFMNQYMGPWIVNLVSP